MTTAILAALVVLAANIASAVKSFTQDPSTGNYTLVYVDKAGVTQTVRVVPVNRIDALVHADVRPVAVGGYEFTYAVQNRGAMQGARGIESQNVPCPGMDSAPSAPEPWSGVLVRFRKAPSCEFTANVPLAVGKSQAGLRVASVNLPAISTLTLSAESQAVFWPSGEATPDDAYEMADSVSLPQTAGVPVTSIAPTRSSSELADPTMAIKLIRSDLAHACALGWVDNQGICRSLDVKLEHAIVAAVLKPQELRAFLSELEAQRGKHVSPEAFALLNINVGYVLSRAAPAAPLR